MNVDEHLVEALIAQLSALREGAGKEMRLICDLNFNYRTEGFKRFAKALEPGEWCFYYVRGGVADRDDSARPILFTRVGGRDGKVFTISIRLGGQARVEDPRVEDWFNKEYLKSKYGIDPSDILAPEGPIPGPWELPLPSGPKISPSVSVASSMGGLAVLLAIYLKFIRKRSPIPIESVPGA